jgi:hypothetical protein
MKKILIIVLVLALAIFIASIFVFDLFRTPPRLEPWVVGTFAECVAVGNPVMESYPRQCKDGDKTFTEDIGNERDKSDLIRLTSPRPHTTITSPLELRGEARGTWFFEASFPVSVVDGNGNELGSVAAQAEGEWMTTEFVPFKAMVTFKVSSTTTGFLVLKKDNPSGLPEHDDSLKIPILFSASTE